MRADEVIEQGTSCCDCSQPLVMLWTAPPPAR